MAMISTLFVAAVGAAMLLIPGRPPAATGEKQGGEEIVVTGERASPEAISRFVDQLTYQPGPSPLSTWQQEVCPSVHGLPAAQGKRIEARMRQVASAAGLRVGGEGCHGNAVLIVAPDKPLLLRTLSQRKGSYFDGLPFWRVNELVRDPSLATAWHLRGEDVRAGGAPADGRTAEQESRLRPSATPTFDAAVVVVDARAIEGLTVTQLADYAAMRAYAPVKPERLKTNSTTTSILSVIDAPATAEVPLGLTRWDLGLLRGLYSGQSLKNAGAKRRAAKDAIEKELGER